MIKKRYLIFLLPVAFIPMFYLSGDFFDTWNRMQQNQFTISTIGRKTTPSPRNQTVKKRSFTFTSIVNSPQPTTTRGSIRPVLKQTTRPGNTSTREKPSRNEKKGTTLSIVNSPQPTTTRGSTRPVLKQTTREIPRNPSTREKPSINETKVPLETFNFNLGPTSAHYKDTPPSDQVGKNLTKDVTVVSAYFRLPPFPKGSWSNIRKPASYEQWMKAFRWIVNPIIIYTDDNKTFTSLTRMFQKRNKTSVKVIKFLRKDLWSFQQLPEVTKILKQKGYPVHYPNSVIPAYNCMTHAKFEMFQKGIERNWFNTKYFIWVDIGYFRDPVSSEFGLDLPHNFDERRVGITVVGTLQKHVTLEQSVRGNLNWVAGGCLLGRFDVLLTFCNEYLDFVKQGIKQKMLGVEQQMMYAMYSDRNKPKTSLQLCSPGWFCMGKLAAQAWAIKHNKILS